MQSRVPRIEEGNRKLIRGLLSCGKVISKREICMAAPLVNN